MATVMELKATARPKAGKGAARASSSRRPRPGRDLRKQPAPRHHLGGRQGTAPAHLRRPFPDHDLRHRSRGQKAPRDPARLPSRSGARLSGACRFHAARRRRHHPRRRSAARDQRRNLAGREARRHGEHRHPHHRARVFGRQHSAIYRGGCRQARNQLVAASERHHAAEGRQVADGGRCRRWSPWCRRRASPTSRKAAAAPAAGACGRCCACSRCCACGRCQAAPAAGGAKAPAAAKAPAKAPAGGDKKK